MKKIIENKKYIIASVSVVLSFVFGIKAGLNLLQIILLAIGVCALYLFLNNFFEQLYEPVTNPKDLNNKKKK